MSAYASKRYKVLFSDMKLFLCIYSDKGKNKTEKKRECFGVKENVFTFATNTKNCKMKPFSVAYYFYYYYFFSKK